MVDLTWSWLDELVDDVIQPGESYAPVGEPAARIRRIPPCPEHPEHPGPDRWMETRSGVVRRHAPPNPGRMLPSFRNGRYQQLLFLGVGGFIVCNHCDKEILLVDPWPTCFSYWTRVAWLQEVITVGREARRDLTAETLSERRRRSARYGRERAGLARERIAHLASFLRKAVEREYSLSGILVSHMHFDHSDDIVRLLELLAATIAEDSGDDPEVQAFRRRDSDDSIGTYTDHQRRPFLLAGPPIDVQRLPKICCDYDTMIYLLTYGFYKNYNDIEIDGDVPVERTVMTGSGPTQERTESRFWSGNEDWKDILDERISDSHDEPDHFINSNNQTWQTVQQRYVDALSAIYRTGAQGGGRQGVLIDNDSWLEISANRSRLHYDDTYNMWLDEGDRCKAGQVGTEFELGNFEILPYVWDHSNTGCNWFGMKRRPGQADQTAGNLQRASAFMIWRKDIEGAKRTFIVGSGGEMHSDFTGALAESMPEVETDVLVQAILPHLPSAILRSLSGFDRQIPHYIDFMVRNIRFGNAREAAVIFIHFEDFIRRVPDPEHYLESFRDSIGHNLEVITEKVAQLRQEGLTSQADNYQSLLDRNRFYVLGRRGFEYNFPYHMLRDT